MTPTAGRDLDALVAEQVMGCRVRWRSYGTTKAYPYCDCEGNCGFHNRTDEQNDDLLECYSTDIAAAWTVVEKIKERGDLFPNVSLIRVIDNKWQHKCEIWRNTGHACGWIAEEYAATATLAICLAALKAVGCKA